MMKKMDSMNRDGITYDRPLAVVLALESGGFLCQSVGASVNTDGNVDDFEDGGSIDINGRRSTL